MAVNYSTYIEYIRKQHTQIYIYTLLGGMDGGQGKFQLWTGEVLDFIYNFTFNPALAHRHATGSSGDLFLNQPVQGFFHSPCP